MYIYIYTYVYIDRCYAYSQFSDPASQVRTLNTALKWQPGNEDIADFAEQVDFAGHSNRSNSWMKC